MTPTIYISAPVTVDWTEVLRVSNRLRVAGYTLDVTAWDRNTPYNKNSVSKCDIFVFMTPNNDWKFSINTLPSGVRREYDKAVSLGKHIFMAYKVAEGNYNLYLTTRDGNIIQGIAGSSAIIWQVIKHQLTETKTVTSSHVSNTASNRDVVFVLEKLSDVTIRIHTPSECVDYDPRLLL